MRGLRFENVVGGDVRLFNELNNSRRWKAVFALCIVVDCGLSITDKVDSVSNELTLVTLGRSGSIDLDI